MFNTFLFLVFQILSEWFVLPFFDVFFLYVSMKWMMRVCVFVLKSHFKKSHHIHSVQNKMVLITNSCLCGIAKRLSDIYEQFYWSKNIKKEKEIILSAINDSFPSLGWQKWASSRYIFALFVHLNICILLTGDEKKTTII